MTQTVNDIHSLLNATEVARVEPVDSLEAVQGALERARGEGPRWPSPAASTPWGGSSFAPAGSCSTPGR